jgi:hypothetical protein
MFAASKTASVSGGYQISRSLRFNSADSANLTRTPASASNQKTWTWSGWIKRSALGTNQTIFNAGGNGFVARFNSSTDYLEVYNFSGSYQLQVLTAQVFRDVSAWYHIVIAIDTTQATDTNRFKLYVNGSQVTSFYGAPTYPSQNTDLFVNGTGVHALGVLNGVGQYFDGYMTEINFVNAQQLTPSSFGETNAQTGVWQPKAYSGSYGTNGFYLNFSDNSNTTAATLGKDYSGNGNNWTPNNFSVTAGVGNDSLVDSPTSYGTDTGAGGTVRGNYATLNPLLQITTSGVTNPTLANGNLNFVGNASTDTSGRSTIGMTSGTWYSEVTISYVSAIQDGVGIAYTQSDSSRTFGVLYRTNGNKLINNTATTYGSSYAAGDVIGIAVDATNNQVTFYKNGTSQGAISFTPTTDIYFSTYGTNASPAFAGDFNFGQRPFAYTAPSGFKALCTQNLPTPTIGATTATQAGKFFNPVLFTPTSYPAVTTGVGFQPDFTWWKNRARAEGNVLWDVLRGNTLFLQSNNTNAENTQPNGWVSNSDGWTASSGSYTLNEAYVAWNWKANGSGSTNTSGSITSTVSANTTSGFSVVTYTGNEAADQTIGHGLGVTPSMIIVKSRFNTAPWVIYHTATGANAFLSFDTSASTTVSGYWGTPSSTTFGIKGGGWANNPNGTVVAYCFAEVAGYSKFGSYTGNGSTDGPFVFTGMRPAYVMIKQSNAAAPWIVFDAARNTANAEDNILYPNTSGAEDKGVGTSPLGVDFLSNGFKIRNADAWLNGNSSTYIYMAFASAPLKFSLAR